MADVQRWIIDRSGTEGSSIRP